MKRTRKLLTEAADLLACCASQPCGWNWGTGEIPGDWSLAARVTAGRAWSESGSWRESTNWRERYAEAEARLRNEAEFTTAMRSRGWKRVRHV